MTQSQPQKQRDLCSTVSQGKDSSHLDPGKIDRERIEIFMDQEKYNAEVNRRAAFIEGESPYNDKAFNRTDMILTVLFAFLLPAIWFAYVWAT